MCWIPGLGSLGTAAFCLDTDFDVSLLEAIINSTRQIQKNKAPPLRGRVFRAIQFAAYYSTRRIANEISSNQPSNWCNRRRHRVGHGRWLHDGSDPESARN